MTEYSKISPDTNNTKQAMEALIFMIENIICGNEKVLAYVYDRVRKVLYHITKRHNPDNIITFHTQVKLRDEIIPSIPS